MIDVVDGGWGVGWGVLARAAIYLFTFFLHYVGAWFFGGRGWGWGWRMMDEWMIDLDERW